MYAVEKLSQYITQGVYTVSGPFHPFGGAVDVIVVQQQDGSFKSSPWYVKFGKVQGVPKTKEKLVCICVNGDEASFHMYLDHKGETYFLREVDGQEEDSIFFLPSSGDETDEKSHNERQTKTKSLSIDDKKHNSVKQIDMGNGKVLSRTNSKRTRFLGLMFGRKSLKDDNRQRKGEDNVDRISSLERAEIAADLLDVKWSTSLRTDKVIPSRDGSRTCNSGKPELEGLNNERDLVENLNEELQFNIKDELYSPVKDHQFSCNPPIDGSVNSVDIVTKPNILESNDSIAFKPVSKLSSSEAFDLVGGVGVRREGAIEREDCSDVENRKDSKELNADVCRLINVETTESSIFETRDLKDQLEENTIGSEKVEIGTEILLPEINSCSISGGITSEENFGGSHCSGSGIPNHIDSGVLEATQQCRVAEGHFKEKALGTNTEDTLAKEPQFAAGDFTSELRFGNDHGVVAQEASVPPDAATVDQMLHSATEEPRAISNIYHVSNLRSQTRLIDNSQEVKVHKLQIMSAPTQESDMEPPSEKIGSPHMHLFQTMEQDQLLFGEIDNVLLNSIQLDENHVNEVDHDSLLSSSNQSFGSPLTNGSASHQEELNQASALCASVLQEPKILSSQIAIPINQIHVEKVKELVQSLPNIQGDIHDLNHRRSHHYLSRSLDSAESLMIVNHGENCLDSFKSKSASEGNFRDILCSRFENTNVMEEGLGLPKKEFTLPHPPVELSLCRHLLSEGMGAEAASLAFDSEKVDLEKFTSLGPSVVKNESLVVRISGCYFPWESAGPIILGMVSFGQECIFKPEGAIHVEKPEKSQRESGVSANGNWSIWPFSFRRSKTIACVPEKPLDDTIYRGEILDGVKNANEVNVKAIKKVRSIVPTSEQLASLILKEGRNMVTFTFSTAMLGKQQVDARIYLWKWNTKIVVSDVDGTITKSDVLGQFMPLMGKDWSHTGVAHLFSAIKENGYEMLFLSARAISQAHLTRQFLFNLKQDGKALPDGPVVISPDGLFPSLYREVIRRAPHEFKISCLEDIRALFPFDCNPFYAGFGNRHTDEISYLKVGIPRGKIFTINARGEVAVSRQVDRKSYTSLHTLVHDMFPARTSSEQEEFNSWNYWRMPIPEIDI